jgi:hypothetical protein
MGTPSFAAAAEGAHKSTPAARASKRRSLMVTPSFGRRTPLMMTTPGG